MEQFANNPIGALSGAITSGATSLTLASATGFPSSPVFRLLIDSELVKVTAVSGTTYTIARADGGTTAASHSSGAPVYGILTKEALDAIVTILNNGTEIGTRRKLNFVGATVTDDATNSRININTGIGFTSPPAVANWTWLNQGSATAIDSANGGIFLYTPPATGDSNHILYRTLTTPFTVRMGFSAICWTQNYVRTGMALLNTSTGKILQYCMDPSGRYSCTEYSTTTSFAGDLFNYGATTLSAVNWLGVTDNGTTRQFQVSADGVNWYTIFSHASSTFTTVNAAGPDVNPNNATFPSAMTIHHWTEA